MSTLTHLSTHGNRFFANTRPAGRKPADRERLANRNTPSGSRRPGLGVCSSCMKPASCPEQSIRMSFSPWRNESRPTCNSQTSGSRSSISGKPSRRNSTKSKRAILISSRNVASVSGLRRHLPTSIPLSICRLDRVVDGVCGWRTRDRPNVRSAENRLSQVLARCKATLAHTVKEAPTSSGNGQCRLLGVLGRSYCSYIPPRGRGLWQRPPFQTGLRFNA